MMDHMATSLCAGLFRTTLLLSAAALVLPWLLKLTRCRSAAVHRFALCLVLLQGWMFAGLNVGVSLPSPRSWWETAAEPPAMKTPAGAAGQRLAYPDDTTEAADVSPAVAAGLPAKGLAAAEPPADATADRGRILARWLAGFWLLGLLLVVVRSMVLYARLVRGLRVADRMPTRGPLGTRLNEAGLPAAGLVPVDAEHQAEWQQIQRDAGITREIPLQRLPGLGPMLLRLPRGYRLIVPTELWGELSREQRLAILRHELAHVKRRDVWKSLAVRVLALPHWFNPLAWRTVRLFDECAEWACDDAVRHSSPRQTLAYARALLSVGAAEPQSLLLSPAVRGRGLSLRIRRLLTSASREDSMMKKTVLATLVTALALFGLVRFQTAADDGSRFDRARSDDAAHRSETTDVEEAAPDQGDSADVTYRDERKTSKRQRRGSFPGDEAVIDMSHIFKNLDEFERGRTRLRDEVAAEGEQAQRDRKTILELQRRLESLDGEPESRRNRESLESDLAENKARLESRIAAAQRRFRRDEAELYYATYQRVTDEVRRYAREHGIRIVRRFNRGSSPDIELDNPQAMIELVNRDVVFVEDPTDITAEVLERLNRRAKRTDENESP